MSDEEPKSNAQLRHEAASVERAAAALRFVVPKPPPQDLEFNYDIDKARARDVMTLLVVLRVINALTLGTFFQPDEFFQAQEPAWALAFGRNSGAWLTWEWTHQLRSSIWPVALAIPYMVVSSICSAIFFPDTLRAQLLLVVPKAVPAISAAMMDYFTWRLAERIYGKGSYESGGTLGFAVFSPWQWFFSTRTFSNNIEATLTAVALSFWPWDWMRQASTVKQRTEAGGNLKYCFLAAATACILRPTNGVIWIILSVFTIPDLSSPEIMSMARSAFIVGLSVLGISTVSDRIYYGNWTPSIFNFLHYNFSEGLADFYGLNRVDYYFTEGVPLLLTTALPFVLYGIVQALLYKVPLKTSDSKGNDLLSTPSKPALRGLVALAIGVPAAFSFIGHKEVRFIYPLLPVLLVLGGKPLSAFTGYPKPKVWWLKLVLTSITIVNVWIGYYFTYIHGRGVIDIHTYLRHEFDMHNHKLVLGDMNSTDTIQHMSVGFLMPCHSTPWRSRLVWPEIDAWALTCEPPVGVSTEARANYIDEADEFYAAPENWLKHSMQPLPLAVSESVTAAPSSKREWPEYVVFFEQLEETMQGVLRGSRYEECWRTFNTRWHYDWRRAGDVIVYCEDRGTRSELIIDEEDDGSPWQLV